MADRDNVKVVISAALIVIIASLGIYAFIYRDKISQMLPQWQSRNSSPERIIENESAFDTSAFDGTPASDPIPGKDTAIEDEDTKYYPDIPNQGIDRKSPTAITTITDTPKTSIDPSTEKKSPSSSDTEKKTTYAPPVTALQKTETVSSPPKVQPIQKQSNAALSTQKQPVQKTPTVAKLDRPAKTKTSVGKTTSPKKAPVSSKKPSLSSSYSPPKASVTNRTNSSKPKTVSSSSTKTSNSSSTGSNLDERVQKLEKKLNVHIQDTNSRLDSLESRIDRLEKKIQSTGN